MQQATGARQLSHAFKDKHIWVLVQQALITCVYKVKKKHFSSIHPLLRFLKK